MSVKVTLTQDVVATTKTTKSGKDFVTYSLVYNDERGEQRTKTAVDFNLADHSSKEILSSAKEGDTLELFMVKKGDFWNINKVSSGSSAPKKAVRPKYNKTVPSNFVSDNKRQESIVFQNALAHATAISLHNSGKAKVDVQEVLKLAKVIADVSIDPAEHFKKAAKEEPEFDVEYLGESEEDF